MLNFNKIIFLCFFIMILDCYRIDQLPYPTNCSNSDQLKALFSQAQIIYGQNLPQQMNYIKEKINRSQYKYWQIRIISQKNKFAEQRFSGWYDNDTCYYTCKNCIKYMPDLSYEVVGIKNSYNFRDSIVLSSKIQSKGGNLTETDENTWKKIITTAKQQHPMDYAQIAKYIANNIHSKCQNQTTNVFVLDNSSQLCGYFPGCQSSQCKDNTYLVLKDDQTTYMIRNV